MAKQVITAVVAALGVGFAAGWLARGAGGEADARAASPDGEIETAGTGGGAAGGTERAEATSGGESGGRVAGGGPGGGGSGDGRAGGQAPAAAAGSGGRAAFDVEAARQALRIAELEGKLRELEERLAEAERGRKAEEQGPAGETAAERRAAAARDGKLLVEFPQWSDELALPDEVAEKHGLSDAEREALDRLYRDFYTRGMAELKRLYRELTGDPNAGESSTLNALLHDVIELSPQEPCRARMAYALRALSAGEPLSAPGPTAPPCALAVWFLFQLVDEMEREAGALGPAAREALWSSRSTFLFSGRSGDGE